MSDAKNFSVDHPINPYYGSPSVDKDRSQAEHDSIREALIEAGVKVISVKSPVDSQDGVYTANWALTKNKKAIMARLPEVRSAEHAVAEKYLQELGYEIIHTPKGLKFSGQGDALPCGNYLFCGQDYRSDTEAQEFAAKSLGLERIQLKTIPQLDDDGNEVINSESGWADSYFYDIDLALAIIKEPSEENPGLIAYCPEAFTKESQEKLESINFVEKIKVSFEEATKAFATNLVSTGNSVVMSDSAPLLKGELESRGINVITPKIQELSKGGGYIRCTSLTLS